MPAPPGPPLPPLAQTILFLFGRERFLAACRRRYGDLVAFRTVFDAGFVVVSDPGATKRLLSASPAQARGGVANASLEPSHGRHSVVLLDGEDHVRQRRLLLHAIQGDGVHSREPMVREAADRAIDSWPVGRAFELMPSMYGLSLDVMTTLVFGSEEAPRKRAIRQRLAELLSPRDTRLNRWVLRLSGGRIGTSDSRARFERRRDALDELVFAEIADRRAASDLDRRSDVLSALLSADRDLGDREVRDQVVTLLAVGHETTATALTWAFELLLRNPPVLERLQRSLREGETDYLDAVVKETLRLRPVSAGIGRTVCESGYELDGYSVEPGVEISPSIAAIHACHTEFPNPERFRPERFLGPDTANPAWIPFGGGTRRCLGAGLAQLEIGVMLRRVFERMTMSPASPDPERSVPRAVSPPTPGTLGRTLRRGPRPLPKHGVRVVVAHRARQDSNLTCERIAR